MLISHVHSLLFYFIFRTLVGAKVKACLVKPRLLFLVGAKVQTFPLFMNGDMFSFWLALKKHFQNMKMLCISIYKCHLKKEKKK